jgi:spore coat protein A
MSEFQTQILPSEFPRTTVWGYNNSYPGPTVMAKRGTPAKVNYVNNVSNPKLLSSGIITVDQTIHWADPLGLNCAMESPPLPADCFKPFKGPLPLTVHLHGAEVPSAFDGHPDSWFTADGRTGPGFVTRQYIYPNNQEATTLFYHDHALGITRLTIFAGLEGFYLIKDPDNETVALPSGAQDIPMLLQDRSFDTNGQLFFPIAGVNPDVHPFWEPEYFGDVIVVNGKSWPFLNVEPKRYRFRMVDLANARFFSLQLQITKGTGTAPKFWQIASDGGYLSHPVPVDTILFAPSERADVVVDFSGLKPGTEITMTNSANAPFPDGDVVDPATTAQVMKFKVVSLKTADRSVPMSAQLNLRPNNPMVDLRPTARPGKVPVRRVTLNEIEGVGGPLIGLLNNSKWHLPVTENPRVGATEIWEMVNLTGDAHPIHIHLIQFQAISHQPFDAEGYEAAYEAAFPGGVFVPEQGPPLPYGNCYPAGVCGGNLDPAPFFTGSPQPPDPRDAGWKDVFKMLPGEVTRVAIRWAPQNTPAGGVAVGTNLFKFDPAASMGHTDSFANPGGPGYVWHCHIIDHEDNEMMRPYIVRH